jgi:hypothetical protein
LHNDELHPNKPADLVRHICCRSANNFVHFGGVSVSGAGKSGGMVADFLKAKKREELIKEIEI